MPVLRKCNWCSCDKRLYISVPQFKQALYLYRGGGLKFLRRGGLKFLRRGGLKFMKNCRGA
jgi:hypothetical protein